MNSAIDFDQFVVGCVKHSTMTWDKIQMPKCAKSNLRIIWLDLTDAYASVPHQLICFTRNFFHIPYYNQNLVTNYLFTIVKIYVSFRI